MAGRGSRLSPGRTAPALRNAIMGAKSQASLDIYGYRGDATRRPAAAQEFILGFSTFSCSHKM